MEKLRFSHLLIIDDEPMILRLLLKILSHNKFKIDTASSGEKGVKLIDKNDYNLILTDIKMPGISGEKILEHSRNSKNHSTPVIGMSGTPWLLDQNLFDAILSKPFTKKELFNSLERLLKN